MIKLMLPSKYTVIAQATQVERPTPRANDADISQVAGIGLGGAVVGTVVLKLFEKFGANAIKFQSDKLALDLKEKEAQLDAEKQQSVILNELLRTYVASNLNQVQQGNDNIATLGERVTNLEKHIEASNAKLERMTQLLNDVLRVLAMKPRE